MRFHALALACALLVPAPAVLAEPCAADDHETRVTGVSQCLLMRRFGTPGAETMVVWLHGDVSSGGPATYHFKQAEQLVKESPDGGFLSIALVRPGYPDGSGESSTVAPQHAGRTDHYTQENLAEVAAAIEKLRGKYQPRRVIAVGHSGGAATTAVVLGMKPRLIDAAVLVACPCDMAAWRMGRRAWPSSEDPYKWVPKVDPSTRVLALTGDRDDNTRPALAQTWVEEARKRGVDAIYRELPGETHNSAFRASAVLEAVRSLAKATSPSS